MTTPPALRLLPWLLLLGAALVAVVAPAPGAHARWSESRTAPGGAVTTGRLDLRLAGTVTYEAGGAPFVPGRHTACVGDTVRVAVPVRVVATGTSMTPTLTRTSGTTGGAVADVDLAAVDAALTSSPAPQDHLVHLDVTVPGPGTVQLREQLTVTARAGGAWAATIPVEATITARTCGTFVSVWDTTSRGSDDDADATIVLRKETTGIGGTIDWGDGLPAERVPEDTSPAVLRHDYAAPGTYTVTLAGVFGSIRFDGSDALISVDRWDPETGTTSLVSAFEQAHHLRRVVAPPPTVTTMFAAFKQSTANPVLEAWDTSAVTTMGSMFYGASAFDQDITEWDTSAVTDLGFMFWGASAFDQDITSWTTSRAERMTSMFGNAVSFNRSLARWDTSRVTDMGGMFDGASAFDGDIASWDTAQVTEMRGMFADASSFTGDLRGWDVARIPTEPSRFRSRANPAMIPPIWGTHGNGATQDEPDAGTEPEAPEPGPEGTEPPGTTAPGPEGAEPVPPTTVPEPEAAEPGTEPEGATRDLDGVNAPGDATPEPSAPTDPAPQPRAPAAPAARDDERD